MTGTEPLPAEATRSRGRVLHDRILAAYALDPVEGETLTELARLVDLLDALHAGLGGELTALGSTGQIVANPLLAEIRAGRRQLLELASSLRLPSGDESGGVDAMVAQMFAADGGVS